MSRVARTVIEVQRGRRIVREYDAAGALLRIRIEPMQYGATDSIPPITETAPAVVTRPKAAPLPKPAAPAPQAREAPAAAPPREAAPKPTPPPPAPAPKPAKRGFTILAAEPSPAIVAREHAIEDAVAPLEDKPIAATPEPPPPTTAPEPVISPAPEAEPQPPAAPEPYVVPDLESRVDELLARKDRPTRAKKRAPLPVPQFEPLRREPWEDRLDAALGASRT